jgi:hypothetical protein
MSDVLAATKRNCQGCYSQRELSGHRLDRLILVCRFLDGRVDSGGVGQVEILTMDERESVDAVLKFYGRAVMSVIGQPRMSMTCGLKGCAM